MQEQQINVVETDSVYSKKYRSRGDAPSRVKGRAATEMSTILRERPATAAEGEYM